VEFIQRKKGIGNITDAVRFALAETAGDLGFEEDKEDGAKDEAPQERDKQR
jgi:hypothetical protein